MNNIFLNILLILGLIAPVCADAVYKRVDSPGVAQRKLNLLLKNVKEMSASQRKQAVADLSPSLKEYYEEMLKVSSARSEKLDNALLVVKRFINEGVIDKSDGSDVIDDFVSKIAKSYDITDQKNISIIKRMTKKCLEEVGKNENFKEESLKYQELQKQKKEQERLELEQLKKENQKHLDREILGQERVELERLEKERLANQLHITNKSDKTIVVRFYYRLHMIMNLAPEYSAYSIAPGRDIYLDLPTVIKEMSRYIVVVYNPDDFKSTYLKKEFDGLIKKSKAFDVEKEKKIIIDKF